MFFKHQIIKSRKTVRDFSDLLENEALTCQSKSYIWYLDVKEYYTKLKKKTSPHIKVQSKHKCAVTI